MQNINVTLQGKGGVGKSLVSSLIAQYYKDNEIESINIDSDPVNRSFASFPSHSAEELLLVNDGKINPRQFDLLMTKILENEKHFIIDNGASGFLPFSLYLEQNAVPELLADSNRQLLIHTIVTGGEAMMDTLTGLKALADAMPTTAKIIVWLNEYFGEVKSDQTRFENMKIYTNLKDRIEAIVTLPTLNDELFREDFRQMRENKLSFTEAVQNPDFNIMSKQRLNLIKNDIYKQIATWVN